MFLFMAKSILKTVRDLYEIFPIEAEALYVAYDDESCGRYERNVLKSTSGQEVDAI